MKKIFKLLAVICLSITIFVPGVMAQESEDSSDIGLTIGIDYMSNYLWRGSLWYGDDGAFFPSVSYDISDTGLTLSLSAEISEDYVFDPDSNKKAIEDIHATDFGVDYSYSIKDMATIGAGLWYYMMWDDSYSFISGYVSASLDSVFLTPTLTYSHDYYTDSEDGKDFYIQLGVSHSFELVKDASLDLGATGGYYYADSTDQKGISDIDFSAGLSVTSGILTYSSGFHYVLVPSEDFYGTPKDISRFYASFGVSASI